MTLDIYSHVTPGLQEAAAQRFEDGIRESAERAKKSVNRNVEPVATFPATF